MSLHQTEKPLHRDGDCQQTKGQHSEWGKMSAK